MRRGYGMMTLRVTFAFTLAVWVLMLGACKKKEAPDTRPQNKTKGAKAKPKRSGKPKLKEAEQKAIAAQRLLEAMKTRKKPFDWVAGAQDVIFKKYGIELKTLFDEKALADVKSGGDLRYVMSDLKSAEEVRAILEDEAAKVVEPNWSIERLEKVKKTANEKFKYFKLQDVVEVQLSLPGGGQRSLKGILEAVTTKDITVAGQRIPYQDLAAPPRWAFDASSIRKRKNSYIYNAYTRPKAEEKQSIKEKLGPDIYKRYGCVQRDGKWVSIKRLFIKEIEPDIDALDKAHDKSERDRFMIEIYEEMKQEGLLDN